MKHFFKIGALLMLLVVLSAEDCSNSKTTREDRLSGMFREIENDFVNDELSVETLSAFEKRAIQKLKDVADYINFYADTSISVEFRTQASLMIRENFTDNAAVLNFYKEIELQEDTVKRNLVIIGIDESFKTKIYSVSISEKLQKKSISSYSGEIQFLQNISEIDSVNSGILNHFQRKIEIQALKTEKKFGEKTEDIWEVYLGVCH